jgi:hypothetical protein
MLAHILEHNSTDPVHRELAKLINAMEEKLFQDAETLRYVPKGVVLEPQRTTMRGHASIGQAVLDGVTMPVTFLGDGDPSAEVFVVDNFLSEAETTALLELHQTTKAAARCAFSGRDILHSRMPLSFTPLLRLKRCHACAQWHYSQVFTPLTDWHCKSHPNTEGIDTFPVGLRHDRLIPTAWCLPNTHQGCVGCGALCILDSATNHYNGLVPSKHASRLRWVRCSLHLRFCRQPHHAEGADAWTAGVQATLH